MSTMLQRPDSEVVRSTRISIAVIGPDDARRRTVAKALGSSESRAVREFAAYPTKLSDVSRMLEPHFDIVMVDLDSDQDYALAIVAHIATISNATVMVYSTRNDPSLMMSSMRAGAREFVPIPSDVVEVAEHRSTPITEDVGQVSTAALASADRRSDPETSINRVPAEANGADVVSPPEPADGLQSGNRMPDFEEWDRIHLRLLKELEVKNPGPNTRSPFKPKPAVKSESAEDRAKLHVVPPVAIKAAEPSLQPPVAPEPAAKGELWLDSFDDATQGNTRSRARIDPSAIKPIFHSYLDGQESEKADAHGTHWVMISMGLGVLACLLFFYFAHPLRGNSSTGASTQGAAAQHESPGAEPEAAKPSAKPSAAHTRTETAGVPAGAEQVSSEMMDAQLAAPSRISSDIKKPAPVEEPPANIAPGGIDSGGGIPSALLGSENRVTVVPTVTAISAGVAEGMLIHKTAPVYPLFAKEHHLGGTVELKAKITRTGAIQDAQVISGPQMFRSSALEAVKTWRYRPYMLDNQPVQVETAIDVVFSVEPH
ncbi:MAG: TonB family protein [Terracidiphilus sp.]